MYYKINYEIRIILCKSLKKNYNFIYEETVFVYK